MTKNHAFGFGLAALCVIVPSVSNAQTPTEFYRGKTVELIIGYTVGGCLHIENAVLLLHGTGGNGSNWLAPSLADELFREGKPLAASQYFIVMPDGIGRGLSSKPSDGLRAKFPHYRSRDVVEADYRLLTDGLGVSNLQLVLGSSSGGMHVWLWGTMYPEFMKALFPLASQPTAMSGRNWLMRRAAIETIRNDTEWQQGNYQKNPHYFAFAGPFTSMLLEGVIELQESAPTREAADLLYQKFLNQARNTDANDLLYAIEMVMDYDPSPDIGRIRAKVLAVNFADDEVNPPELNLVEPAIRGIPDAKLVVVPASATTRGHSTHRMAKVWQPYLADLMKSTANPANP